MDTGSIRRSTRAVALILLGARLAQGGTRHNFDRAVLFHSFHPDLPMSRFVAGQIGIPEPQYARIYLFAAYRYLEGKPLSAAEQRRWLAVWRFRTANEWPREGNRDAAWRPERQRVPVPLVDYAPDGGYRKGRFFTFESLCSKDAFDTAARTLSARIMRFGAHSPEVKFWTQGQDAVFAKCGGVQAPGLETAPATMHPVIRADRAHQIAAAHLYQDRFDDAISAFRAIAQDRNSPWRAQAPYQMGRAMLWKARSAEKEPTYRRLLLEAERQFRAVLRDPALREWHAASERLLLRCMMITDRRGALARIGARLMNATWTETDLAMYLEGMDWLEGDPWDGQRAKPVPLPDRPRDALSQWLLAFRAGVDANTSIAKWKETGSRAWLYAALWSATSDAPEELLQAETGPSPALRYGMARLLANKGRFAEARQLAHAVATELVALPSAYNRTAQLRAQLAETFDEFLRLAPRRVVVSSSELDTGEWTSHDKPEYFHWLSKEESKESTSRAAALMRLPRFDDRSADIFNDRVPLRMQASAASSGALPAHLRNELTVAAWTRAALLDRAGVARQLEPLAAKAFPVAAVAMKRYDAQPVPANAAIVLLALPGARPYVSRGYGRGRAMTERDDFARNWWYRFNEAEMHQVDLPYTSADRPWGLPSSPPLPPKLPFLTEADVTEAATENAALAKTGTYGLRWISHHVMQAVRTNPSRPDAAELLARLLDGARSSQWAQPPDHNVKYPDLREAFRLMSTRYRTTKWFREIEYWELPIGVTDPK